jgi:DNA-binding NarL/FixJ family response regulator
MSAIQQLADGYPAVRPLPLILSGVADAEQVRAAMERGAWGYVIKGVSGTELVHAGRSIHHGERLRDARAGG